MTPTPVRIAHIEVKRDRIVASVAVSEERFVYTSQRVVEALLPRYPHLLEHSCVNDRGATFADVAFRTSTPHLLEHMAIENQVLVEVGEADGVCVAADTGTQAGDGREALSAQRNLTAAPTALPKRASYVGKTRWTDRKRRQALVEISFVDDIVALRALRDAACDLNDALLREQRA